MNILGFFGNMPGLLFFSIMCAAGIVFTVAGIHIMRVILPMDLRLKDNVAIGYISANTAVVFAILAGFIISYMLGNLSRAQTITRDEINRLHNIYLNAARLDGDIKLDIRTEVKKYFVNAIANELPAMKKGQEFDAFFGDKILTDLRIKLVNYKTRDFNQSLTLAELHKDLEQVYNVRDERYSMNKSALSADIWVILIVVTFFTLIMNFVYGMEHYLHLILAPVVSTVIISLLFLIITIDRPFRDKFSTASSDFQYVLNLFDHYDSKAAK
jgi:hypothetical protein